jgi:hypothetical protein
MAVYPIPSNGVVLSSNFSGPWLVYDRGHQSTTQHNGGQGIVNKGIIGGWCDVMAFVPNCRTFLMQIPLASSKTTKTINNKGNVVHRQQWVHVSSNPEKTSTQRISDQSRRKPAKCRRV